MSWHCAVFIPAAGSTSSGRSASTLTPHATTASSWQPDRNSRMVEEFRRAPPAALRTAVLQLCAQERYGDFGPTLMAEELAQQGLVVDHDTLRRWWLAAGRGPLRRRRQQHRQWRERKPCLGAMIQLDGSHHDWFEGRGAPCVLMVMVDDATNRMRARFF